MYKIKVSYQTGDSFHTEDDETILEYGWENIDVVTQNLKRIREHYEMYQEMADRYHASFKEMKRKYGKKDWFVDGVKSIADQEFIASHTLYLYLDDGSKFQYSCEWCGYFERLYGAEVLGPSFEF
ncbi:MAG: hypothetical protein ACLFPS_09435 [Clostridia bacterium]